MVDVDALVFRAVPFYHAQVGINDTPITRALEEGQFKLAQQLILENTDRSYLDEGPFVKIPLALVLSGDPEFRKHRRHLGLAKLLVEHGANPNLRIPTSELQRASPSPMEYLINLLSSTRDVALQARMLIFAEQSASAPAEDDEEDITNPLRTIGLNGEEKLSAKELREQLLTLLDIFLANDGDPNVTTSISNSTLFHIVLSDCDPDMEVALKLCEAGGNLNTPNGHGTTPLMDLISYADGDAALFILRRIWEKNPDISSLESQNFANETALWRAMLAGSPQLAVDLLHRGADPGHRAKVYAARWQRLPSLDEANRLFGEPTSNGVSALYAPLLQQSSPYINYSAIYTNSRLESIEKPLPFDINLMNKVMACAVYPVVDNTYTSELFTPSVLEELKILLSSETKFDAQELLVKGITMQEIGLLLFGNSKAGLQQLCIRQILQQVLFEKPLTDAFELINNLKGSEDETKAEEERMLETKPTVKVIENWDDELTETDHVQACPSIESSSDDVHSDVSGSNKKKCGTHSNMIKDHWNLIYKLSPSIIHKLVVSVLHLPTVLVSRFEIEAARLQLGASLYTYEHVGSMVDWEEMSYEGSTEQFLDIFDEGEFEHYASDSYDGDDYDDDDDDDDSDYRFFVRHCADDGHSFTYPQSSSPSSSSSEDILFPCHNVTEAVTSVSQSQKPVIKASPPSECSEVDQNSLNVDAVKDINESGAPASGNCSSEEQVPSSVRRDEYQKLSSDICSTSSSEMSSNNSANNNETTNSR